MSSKKLAISISLLLLVNAVHAESIYKCTKKDKSIIFTDKPCPPDTEAKIVYTATEQEMQRRALEEKVSMIKKLISGNQANAAKEYAQKNNLTEVYLKELASYSAEKVAEERENAERDRERQAILQQQAIRTQQQQLELQRQQMALEKARTEQQQNNNPFYYGYPYRRSVRVPNNDCRRVPSESKFCVDSLPSRQIPTQFPATGMNQPSRFSGQINPQQNHQQPFSPATNPPQRFPSQMNPPRR